MKPSDGRTLPFSGGGVSKARGIAYLPQVEPYQSYLRSNISKINGKSGITSFRWQPPPTADQSCANVRFSGQ